METKPFQAGLASLTEAVIRARSSETSYERGRGYYTGGAISHRIMHPTSLEAHVEGSQTYRVSVWVVAPGEIKAHCNCPYDWGGDCKHIVATLLAWLKEPESFKPPVDLKAVLKSRSKSKLIDLLLDIFAIYPNLVTDLEVVTGPQDDHLVEKVAELFDDMHPLGSLSETEVETHLRLIARRAARLARQGQTELARRIYYALTLGCVNVCRNYATPDFFSPDIPYVFAEAYDDLAAEQVPAHGAAIKAEIDELYRDLYDPEVLGLYDALSNTWCELIDHKLVDGEVTEI